MTLTEIKRHLEERGLRPLSRFGQNFLYDQNLIRAIVDEALAGLPADATVLEIGPGLGALTGEVLGRGHAVTAIEIDRGLAGFLRERFAAEPKFTLIEGDALDILADPNAGRAIEPTLVLGNLPYYISTPLLTRAIDLPLPPQRMVLTLQKEVAERLAAKHGTAAYGSLSIFVQVFYGVRLIRTLPPNVFYPAPEVDSAAVLLERHAAPPLGQEERGPFQAFVKKGFSQRRKKLSNTLGIDDGRRAEELSIADWIVAWRQWRQAQE